MDNSFNDAVNKLNGILSEPSQPTAPNGNPAPEANQGLVGESSEAETHKLNADTQGESQGDTKQESDYQKKMSSLNEERKAFESQKSEFDTKLNELTDLVMSNAQDLESDEMKELKELDPTEYWKKFEAVKSQAEKLKSYREQRDSELADQYSKLVQSEQTKYAEVIPEWLDDKAKSSDIQMMGAYLKKTGFSDQEIGSIYDSRHLATIRKAALYDQITAKSKDIQSKRVKEPPKSATPSSTNQAQEKTRRQKSMDRLKQTGKLNDATAAIKDILFS
jgi:hypothetical protein